MDELDSIDGDAGIRTPSSIASPRLNDVDRDAFSDPPLHSLLSPSDNPLFEDRPAGADPQQPSSNNPFAHKLHDLWVGARHVHRDADSLRGVLRIVRHHVEDLQTELVTLREDVRRRQQAAEIALMEKDCELRMLQSEAAAYRMAAEARTAAMVAVEAAFRALQQEKEDAERTLEDQSHTLETIQMREIELETTARDAKTALEALQEQHAEVSARLQNAQTDAATAAEQLIEACDENARLAEALAVLEDEAEQWEGRAAAWQQRETAMTRELDRLSAENSRLRTARGTPASGGSALQRGSAVVGVVSREVSGNEATPAALQKHQQFLTPASVNSSGAGGAAGPAASLSSGATADHEDLLAVELSLLRQRNAALEAELASSRDSGPLLAALQRENESLRVAAERSAAEAQHARKDLHRVQHDAQTLHTQLSHVINSLAAAGLADSPVGPLQLTAPASDLGDTDATEVPLTLAAATETHQNYHHYQHHTLGKIHELMSETSAPSASAPSGGGLFAAWPPATPTHSVSGAGAGSMSGGVRGGLARGSDTSSDFVVAELRAAMASLDSRSPTATDGAASADGRFSNLQQQQQQLHQQPGQLRSAADVLTAISQGIACLGRSENGDAGNSKGASPLAATSLGQQQDAVMALHDDDIFN